MATIDLCDLVKHAHDSMDSHLNSNNMWAVCKNYHNMSKQEQDSVMQSLSESDGVDFHRTYGTPIVLVSHKMNRTPAVACPVMQHFSSKKIASKTDEIAKFLSVTNKCMPINSAIAYALWDAVARGAHVAHNIDGVEYHVVAAAYGAYEMKGYAFNPITIASASEYTTAMDDAVQSLAENTGLHKWVASKMLYNSMEQPMTCLMYERTMDALGHVVSSVLLEADDGSTRTVYIDGTAWQVDPKSDKPIALYLDKLPPSYGDVLQKGEPNEQFCSNPMVVEEVADSVAAYYCTTAKSKRVASCIRRFHSGLDDFFGAYGSDDSVEMQ
jgi:hypothetical protein